MLLTIRPLRPLTLLLLTLFSLSICLGQDADDKTQQAIALFNQGQDAHEKGDLPLALSNYEKALGLLPEFPEAELQRGSALLSLKRPDEAEKAFRRALELREDWTLAMSSLGSLLVERGKYDEAENLLNTALEADEANQPALAALADLRLRTGADDASLRAILAKLGEQARKVRPTLALLTAKAAVELKLKDLRAAKKTAASILAADTKNVAANMIAAEIALMERDPDRADTYLDAAGPATDESKRLRAVALRMRGKNNDALAILQSIEEPSESVTTLIAEIKDGDVADLAGLEAKVQRTPDDANALAKLCHGFRVSDPAKAIEYCRRASEAEPNEIGHAIGFGAALVQAKHYDAAVGLFRKLLTIAPENATIRANLATALFQLKRYPEAKTEFRWLTEKQPASPAAFYFLAIVHDQLGEYLDALANYQHFLRIADAEKDKLDIERVNLRLPAVQRLAKKKG